MSSPAPDPNAARVDFILSLGEALHGAGTAAHRLEEILSLAAARLGMMSHFFSTPTSIFASFGSGSAQRTYLIRVEPADTDLDRLVRLDAIARAVMAGRQSPAEGLDAIQALRHLPAPYGPATTVFAFGLASAAAALFLGGGWPEIATGGAVGLLIGMLALVTARHRGVRRVFEPVAATIAAAAAGAIATMAPVSAPLAALAGLIVLVPGFSLTTAMAELSTRHLVSGTARLSGAFIVFLGIGFGVAIGTRIALLAFGAPPPVVASPPPGWAVWAALVVAAVGFTILLRAPAREIGWIVGSGLLAILGARFGAQALGPELGMFVGALLVGVGSNLYSWLTHRPAAVPLAPGVLMLVPGSTGFRSIISLLDREVVSGVDTAFRMILVAMALVAGLLIANVVFPERHVD